MSKPVILTGLRANNDLHIGNYFGALLPMVDMTNKHAGTYRINLFVPDLHSFTTPIDHGVLYAQTIHNLKIFTAAGLDLHNADLFLYRQSFIPAHSELTWILDCFTSFGEMSKMTQFKDKSGRIDLRNELNALTEHVRQMSEKFGGSYGPKEALDSIKMILGSLETLQEQTEKEASVGLFNYPVLMAADILLYDADYVPVGEDQSQHLEFTRDIALRMNSRFGELFTVPKPVKEQHAFFGKDQGLRIKDLDEPTKKMSKSDETGKGVIFLGDDPAVAAKKIMSATTDSVGSIHFDRDAQPGISNLLQILALLKGAPLDEVVGAWEGKSSYGKLKSAVAEQMQIFLEDFQKRLVSVDEDELLVKLESSEASMREAADATLLRVQRAIGLRSR